MKKLLIILTIVVTSSLFVQGAAKGDLINGDFSNGLNGWTTADNNTTIPSASVAVNASGQAELWTQGYDSGVKLISLYQSFTFPAAAYALSFDIGFFDLGEDTGSNEGGYDNGFFDTVFVSYLDDSNSFYDRNFLGLDATGPFDPDTLAPLTLIDLGGGMYRFTAILGSGFQNRTGTLYFDLFDDDDFRLSLVKVDNVQITSRVPEPSSLSFLGWGLWGLSFFFILRRRVCLNLNLGRKMP